MIISYFCWRDVDDSKYIRMDECMAYFEVEYSKFNECMFGVFSDEDRVHISFIEFVSTMWNFLTVTTLNMSKFVFAVLSPDKDVLSPEEVIALLHKIHSKASLKSNNSNTLDELKSMKSDKLFNIDQFAKLVRWGDLTVKSNMLFVYHTALSNDVFCMWYDLSTACVMCPGVFLCTGYTRHSSRPSFICN